jgi:mono/diheme cytochrome c family protein
MTHTSFARPTIALFAAAAIAACHSGGAKTAAAPAPVQASSAPAASSAAARPAAMNALPAGVTARMIAQGDSIFHAKSCVRCHGADAKGAKNGPDLTASTHLQADGSYAGFVKIITDGVPADAIKDKSHQFAMRPRGGQAPLLTDDEVKAVAAYVYSLSHK